MKVKLTKEAKRYITLEEAPAVRRLIQMCKEDDSFTVEEAAALAAVALLHTNSVRVLEASAEISGNCRLYDYYFEGSGKLDVYLTAIAMSFDEVIEFGAYLSDIYSITGNSDDAILNHAYVRRFKEVK